MPLVVFGAEDLPLDAGGLLCAEPFALVDLPPLSPTLAAASTAPLIAPTAAPPAAPTTTSPIAATALLITPLPDDDFLAVVLDSDVFFAEAVVLEVVAFFAGAADFEADDLEVAAGFFAASGFLVVKDFFESVPDDLEAAGLLPVDEEVLLAADFVFEAVDFALSFLLIVAIAFSSKFFLQLTQEYLR